MKKSLTYILLLGAMLGTVSCDKQNGGSTFADPWEHFGGYMQFATGVNNGISITRGALVDNVRIAGYSFGVRGYIYDDVTSWNVYKNGTTASPNLFDGAPAHNLQVSYGDDGIWSYDSDGDDNTDNDKPWDATQKYSFFAYAPYNGNGITLSSTTTVGTPSMTYRYGWAQKAANGTLIDVIDTDKELMYDLMTADAIDVSGASGRPISLDFEHRLFGIEVLANNYNENYFKVIDNADGTHSFEYQYFNNNPNNVPVGEKDYNDNYRKYTDGVIGSYNGKYGYYFLPGNRDEPLVKSINPDGSKVYHRWGRREVTNMTVTVSNLQHTSTKLFLSANEGADEPDGVAPAQSVTFRISKNEHIFIPAFNEVLYPGTDMECEGGVATSISHFGSSNHNGYLMFIPQNAPISCTLNWNQLSEMEGFNNKIDSPITQFEAGRLYQLLINYIGESITIALIEAGKWTPHDVYYTFE